MVSTPDFITPVPETPVALLGERRVVFNNLSWENYQQILHALGEGRSARLTFDCGTLEITMPLEDHEIALRLIERFIYILLEELGQDLKTMGSTTLNYPDLNKGAEPDNAYYIQNQPKVAGKKVDLTQDPSPDLVVEVDITHTDINKPQLYAAMGVPEFWRYNGRVLRIYQLQAQQYVEVESSPTFPTVPKSRLYEFLEDCRQSELQASKTLRAWVQQALN